MLQSARCAAQRALHRGWAALHSGSTKCYRGRRGGGGAVGAYFQSALQRSAAAATLPQCNPSFNFFPSCKRLRLQRVAQPGQALPVRARTARVGSGPHAFTHTLGPALAPHIPCTCTPKVLHSHMHTHTHTSTHTHTPRMHTHIHPHSHAPIPTPNPHPWTHSHRPTHTHAHLPPWQLGLESARARQP